MSKIRVAILGMGGMGCKHLNILLRMEDVQIAALCAHHAATAEQFNRENGTSFPVYKGLFF